MSQENTDTKRLRELHAGLPDSECIADSGVLSGDADDCEELWNAIPVLLDALDAAETERKRLLGLLHRDKTGLAKGLVDVRRIALGFDWLCEGRGPYTYDDDRYRMEIGHLVSQVVEVAQTALEESGDRVGEAFHPRAQATRDMLLADCAAAEKGDG